MKKTLVLAVVAATIASVWLGAPAGRSAEDPGAGDTIAAVVSPSTIVIGADAAWVTVHTDLPLSAADPSTVTLNGIDVAWVKADAKGNLVAKFSFEAVELAVSPPAAVLVLRGALRDGTPFQGTDVVAVRRIGGR